MAARISVKKNAGEAARLAAVGTVLFAIILKILSFHSDDLLSDSVVGGKMWVFILNYLFIKCAVK